MGWPASAGGSERTDDSPDRATRVFDRLALSLSVLVCAALAFLAVNEPWVSDDFSGALFLKEHPGLWETVSYGYQTWTGRFAGSAFSWMAMQVRPVYGIGIWLGLLALVVLTFALARGRFPRARRSDLYVLCLLLLAYWYGLPALEETIFWTAGSLVYLWPALAVLLFLYPYRRWDPEAVPARASVMREVALALGMLLLGVFVGGSQEQVLVAGVLYLFVLALRAARSGKLRRIPAHFYSGALGLVAAGAISLAAPGNSARLDVTPSEGLLQTAIAAAKYVVHILVDWMPPMTPWLLCLALLAIPVTGVLRNTKEEGRTPASLRSDWWLWVLLGLATVSTLFVRPYFAAERTVMFLAVFLAVGAVSLQTGSRTTSVLERLPALAASAALCLLLLVTVGDVALSGWQARSLRLGQQERAEDVARQKQEGLRDIVVAPLTDDVPRRGVMWGDGTADKAFWINGILASWYEVDSVVVSGGAQPEQGSQ